MKQIPNWTTYRLVEKYYNAWRTIVDTIKDGESDSEEWKYYQAHKDDSREKLSEIMDLMEKNLNFYPHHKWLKQCVLKHVVSDYILRENGGLDEPEWFSKHNNGKDLEPSVPDPDDQDNHL